MVGISALYLSVSKDQLLSITDQASVQKHQQDNILMTEIRIIATKVPEAVSLVDIQATCIFLPWARVKLCKLGMPQIWKEREESEKRGKTRGWRQVGVCVWKWKAGRRNVKHLWCWSSGCLHWSQPVTSEARLYKCQRAQKWAVSKRLHQSHHAIAPARETNGAPSAIRGLMDRLLCDCVIAVAVLLCVAPQVRPAHASLQQFVVGDVMCACMRARRWSSHFFLSSLYCSVIVITFFSHESLLHTDRLRNLILR